MTVEQLETAFQYISNRVNKDGLIPGKILTKANIFVSSLAKHLDVSEKYSSLFANIFLQNDYISYDSGFLKLTEKGYEAVKEEKFSIPKIDLRNLLPSNKENISLDQLYYLLWDIIGNDKDNNPYYVDGKSFFDLAKLYCVGLPSSYSMYLEELKLQKKSQTRSKWCKDLFLQIGWDSIHSFIDRLSSNINHKIENKNQTLEVSDVSEEIIKDLDTDILQPTNNYVMKEKKKVKIFISHNTKDKEYAKALVDMLIKLGLNEERDIFCSSVPGCGVAFGDDIMEAIRQQYENNDLIVLFIHSPRLYESPVSLNEMGAGWILRKAHRSFLTLDCSFDMLKGVIPSSISAFKAGQENTYPLLNDFKTFIEVTFNLNPKSQNRWDEIKKDFIKAVESIEY